VCFIHKYTRYRHPCGRFDIYLLWKWDSLITLWHVKTLHIIIRRPISIRVSLLLCCHLITIYIRVAATVCVCVCACVCISKYIILYTYHYYYYYVMLTQQGRIKYIIIYLCCGPHK